MVQERRPGVVLSQELPVARATFVDNIAVIGIDAAEVDRKLGLIVSRLKSLALQVHEIEHASRNADFIGLSMRQNRFSIKTKRLWILRMALHAALRRKKCRGVMLEALMGHLTWAMLLRRPALAIFDKVYQLSLIHI